MRARIEEPDPFEVGDRVKTFVGSFNSPRVWCHGTIISIAGNVAIVRFDALSGIMSQQELAWRIERLEYENQDQDIINDDYFA